MECPVCKSNMAAIKIKGIDLDECSNCHGLWFDNYEIENIEKKANDDAGDSELQRLLSYPRKPEERKGKISCPHCNIPMVSHLYNGTKNLTIDRCYKCNGVWLDAGEIAALRENYMDPKAREEMVKQMFSKDVQLSKTFEQISIDHQKALKQMKRFVRALGMGWWNYR